MFGSSYGAEGFAAAGCADAAGDVELAREHVLPERVAGLEDRLVAGDGGDVGHAGVHVDRAHGVADRLVLLEHLHVRLVVLEPARIPARRRVLRIRARAALVEQELREVEVPRLPVTDRA
jgi:hypothetical protein